jgi:hypothetical protein
MADNNKLELVVEVDVNKANASIKSVNTGLTSMEQAATQAARGASQGIDGMTASMVKGATAGNLLADSIKQALNWAKEWTIGAAQYAAHTDKMALSMESLAKAHKVSSESANKAVLAVKAVGFETQDANAAIARSVIVTVLWPESLGPVGDCSNLFPTPVPESNWTELQVVDIARRCPLSPNPVGNRGGLEQGCTERAKRASCPALSRRFPGIAGSKSTPSLLGCGPRYSMRWTKLCFLGRSVALLIGRARYPRGHSGSCDFGYERNSKSVNRDSERVNPFSASFEGHLCVVRGLGAGSASFCHYNRRSDRIGPRWSTWEDGPSDLLAGHGVGEPRPFPARPCVPREPASPPQ